MLVWRWVECDMTVAILIMMPIDISMLMSSSLTSSQIYSRAVSVADILLVSHRHLAYNVKLVDVLCEQQHLSVAYKLTVVVGLLAE